MRYSRNIVSFFAVFCLGLFILSATGNIENILYRPLNPVEDGGDQSMDEISVRDNSTFAVKIPEKLSLAGEPVPLDNMDVRERLDRELTVNSYWHSSTILMLKRSNRWFPLIERILHENGVPEDFKYLAMAESGLQNNVVSSKGAAGYWQFLKNTGRERGLVINGEIDERYHVEKATKAACDHLKQLKNYFGSWTMAAAAYNVGQYGLKKQVDRQQQDNYYNLLLNSETSRYVFRILALKAIHTAQEDFGFNLTESDMYKEYPYKIFIVDETVNSWPEFCDQNNITYRELKLLNPWLREAHLTNTAKKEYRIKVMEKEG